MEVATNLDFIYSPLHRIHAFESHAPCGHYINTQFLGKGAVILERPGEVVLKHYPSESSRDDSSPIIIPHLEEPLESHVTLRSL